MLKKLMITTAAAALLSGSMAVAQSPQSQSPSAQPASPAMKQEGAKRQFITEQKPDQWLASKFQGTDVIGQNNEKIGDVNDILFDKSGSILAVVVGVGGFLGIGEKSVALSLASFDIQPATDKEQLKLKLSMSKEELKQAAEFKPYTPPRPATTMAPSQTPRPGSKPERAPVQNPSKTQ